MLSANVKRDESLLHASQNGGNVDAVSPVAEWERRIEFQKWALLTQVRKEVPQNSGDRVYSSQSASLKGRQGVTVGSLSLQAASEEGLALFFPAKCHLFCRLCLLPRLRT